jgi:hypothetical protein
MASAAPLVCRRLHQEKIEAVQGRTSDLDVQGILRWFEGGAGVETKPH